MSDKTLNNETIIEETGIDKEKLFDAWINGSPLDDSLARDENWMSRVQAANFVQQQSNNNDDIKVPEWDRSAAFTTDKSSWWTWSKLPAVSMAFSIFAVFLVLFNVKVAIEPEGMLVSFGQHKSQTDQRNIDVLVDLKLKEFAAEQQVVLANYASDINQKQQDSNLQLATYILGTSRQERKEDISDFVRYINDQREDEQLDQKIKFQRIEYKLNQQESLFNTNVFDNNLGSNTTFTPSNYISEEE